MPRSVTEILLLRDFVYWCKTKRAGVPSICQEDQQVSQGPAGMLRQSAGIIDAHSDLQKPNKVQFYQQNVRVCVLQRGQHTTRIKHRYISFGLDLFFKIENDQIAPDRLARYLFAVLKERVPVRQQDHLHSVLCVLHEEIRNGSGPSICTQAIVGLLHGSNLTQEENYVTEMMSF